MKDKKLLKKNKELLLQERERIAALRKRVDKYPEEIGSKEDENATEVAMYAANLAEEHDLDQKLKKVEAALGRIEQGKYGICQIGGEEIERERLEAAPEAANCVEHDQK